MKLHYIPIFLSLLSLVSCDAFDYHPYDGYVRGEKDTNNKNIIKIEKACKGKDTIRFAFMGDSQRHYTETEEFVTHINKQNGIDFVIHGGDIANYGATDEFIWVRDIMNKLKCPYVAIVGNHDCIGTGNFAYSEIFGEYNFAFTAGDIRFICLNTNTLEFHSSVPVPDFSFIRNELRKDSADYSKTVIAMHARPGHDQFNNNVKEYFQDLITQFPQLQFCLNAHAHILTADDLFNDGIIYYGCEAIGEKDYLLFTVTPNGYSYETIYF